ncbi:hypothetical protein GQT40_004235 [Salmonella enterica]|nr:hypothetical protein [Salmonella enterica]EEH0715603.1 hypothetical protein [Salmonella enterica]
MTENTACWLIRLKPGRFHVWRKFTRSTLFQWMLFRGMAGVWVTVWFTTDWLHDYY